MNQNQSTVEQPSTLEEEKDAGAYKSCEELIERSDELILQLAKEHDEKKLRELGNTTDQLKNRL